MKVTYWANHTQAYFHAESCKAFTKSIRFNLADGSHITVKRDDLINIEEEAPAVADHGQFVNDAIKLMNEKYLPGIVKLLEKEENAGSVTITVNRAELGLLKRLLKDKAHQTSHDWYETTHDETYDYGDVLMLAHDLHNIETQERRYWKLFEKLMNARP